MPVVLKGPFNTIIVPMVDEQPPLMIPVAGGAVVQLSVVPLMPSPLARFKARGEAEMIARAAVIRRARIAADGVATAAALSRVIRRALVNVAGLAVTAPSPRVIRRARVVAQGVADAQPVAAVRRVAGVAAQGVSGMTVVVQPREVWVLTLDGTTLTATGQSFILTGNTLEVT